MSSEWGAANIDSIAWAIVYGLTTVAMAVAAFQVGFGSRPRAGRAANFWATCLAGLGALPALDLGEAVAGGPSSDGRLLAQAIFVLAGLALVHVVIRWAKAPTVDPARISRLRAAIALAALAIPTLLWSARNVYCPPTPAIEDAFAFCGPLPAVAKLSEIAAADLRTDRGTKIAAYRLVDEKLGRDALLAQLKRDAPTRPEAAISVGPPEIEANCHGRVFADGQAIIRGDSIDCILLENDYRPVESPEPGDLIVYRDSGGAVLHTGVVKAVGREAFVLIESKWGVYGTYLHESRQQSYSPIFAFYRSPRRGHRLRGRVAPSRNSLSGRSACRMRLDRLS
jgi:hypothetical protein